MTSCADDTLRDLLPGWLAERLAPAARAAVAAHLASCADCRAELALLTVARRALPATPPMDVGRIAAALPAPPAAPARGPTIASGRVIALNAHRDAARRSRPFALATALAAAAVVAGLMITPPARREAGPAASAPAGAGGAPRGGSAPAATEAAAGSLQLALLDGSTLTTTEYDALMDELEATSEILAPLVQPPADSTAGGV